MAFNVSQFLGDLPTLFLISIISAFCLFPFVFFMSFVYDKLADKYEKAPKVLLMLACTILGAFLAVLLLYFYFKDVFLPAAGFRT